MKLSIGLLVIATRQYRERFVGNLLTYTESRFFPDDDVEVHLFSEEAWPRTTWHPIEAMAFPKVTLHRYHSFLTAEDSLRRHDYLFYIDVDSRLERTIGREVLPDRPGIVALHHTGFPAGTGGWDTRHGSTGAAMSPGSRTVYFMGGFNGGTTPEYLDMAHELRAKIDEDDRYGRMAIWHDESMLNRYLADNPPALVLPQSYSGREGFVEWPERTITWLQKDHDRIRA